MVKDEWVGWMKWQNEQNWAAWEAEEFSLVLVLSIFGNIIGSGDNRNFKQNEKDEQIYRMSRIEQYESEKNIQCPWYFKYLKMSLK